MAQKRGRPKKAEADRRGDLLAIRLESLEKETFSQAARVAGLSLSSWARERLRMSAIRELEQAGLRAAFLADFYGEKNRSR